MMIRNEGTAAVAELECPWESGALGNSIEHAKQVSKEHAAAVDESLALQMISIRLPKSLIEDLKYFAEREGLGYQPLMRRVLLRYVAHEYKSIAREQFGSSTPKVATKEQPVDEVDERRVACR